MNMHGSPGDRFRHEAMFYAGWPDFLAGTVPFIRHGLELGEPVLVVESLAKINMLRTALGRQAESVLFADMSIVGANPARIIPAWQEFVDRYAAPAQRVRGIGEPIWSGRPADELVESQRHEVLLNTAFDSGRPWSLLCPYDTAQLPAEVIAEARRSHEFVSQRDAVEISTEFLAGSLSREPLDAPLPELGHLLWTMPFEATSLRLLRDRLLQTAELCRVPRPRAADLVHAVNEIATNSIVYGGGRGVARCWAETDRLVCDVQGKGTVGEPLADRRRPDDAVSAPRGLWLANQLCDLVQIRSDHDQTTVRVSMQLKMTPPIHVLGDNPALN